MKDEIIKELTEVSNRVYHSIQKLEQKDYELLDRIFNVENVEYGRIRNFNQEDSKQIVTLTVKQNATILLKYLVSNNVTVPSNVLDSAINMLFVVKENPQNISALMEKQRIEREIFNLIVDICYITKYVNDKLKSFVRDKTMPDEVSVNFALLVDGQFKSYELSVLNTLTIDSVLVNFIESYKHKMRKVVKETIIDELVKKLPCKNMVDVYSIFFLINERTKKEYFNIKEEPANEYIGFVSSLIRDESAADFAHEKLNVYFDRLEDALKQFVQLSKGGNNKMRDEDKKIIFYILTAIKRISKFRPQHFVKYLGLLQEVMQFKIGSQIKGVIYEILTIFLTDKDVFIKKNVDCKDELEKELKMQQYHLLPRVIKFINEYHKRKSYEEMLVNTGKSIGSPYLNVDESEVDFKMWGLKSEDPLTVVECFDGFIDIETIKLNIGHLRNTILKNANVVEKLVEWQINNKIVIRDVAIINLIVCNPSKHFFTYIRLFDDFSFYLNTDLLERLSDNPTEGIKWMLECYTKELGQFIINNCNFFNLLIKNNTWLQIRLMKVYDKVIDNFIDQIIFKTADATDENLVDVLLLSKDDQFITKDFFIIFAKQLIYNHFYKGDKIDKDVLLDQYKNEGYIEYVKAKIAVGCDVTTDIEFLKSNLINTDELIGFYNIVSDQYIEPGKSQSILGNFGKKDQQFFIKKFQNATEFEKFILFFSIDDITPAIESLIKDEIMSSIKTSHKLYVDMCVLQLFKCADLDNIIIVLEKMYHNQQMLSHLALVNLSNGGKYFSKQLLDNLPRQLTSKALFFIYFNNVWDKEDIYKIVAKMDYANNNELSKIVEDYKKLISY